MKRRAASVLAIGLFGWVGTARAGAAWDQASAVLPADTCIVGGANVATIRKSTLYQTLVPHLMQHAGAAQQGLAMGDECQVDIATASMTEADASVLLGLVPTL